MSRGYGSFSIAVSRAKRRSRNTYSKPNKVNTYNNATSAPGGKNADANGITVFVGIAFLFGVFILPFVFPALWLIYFLLFMGWLIFK